MCVYKMQKLYMENREQKIELLKSLTLGREDSINLSPLSQVGFTFQLSFFTLLILVGFTFQLLK